MSVNPPPSSTDGTKPNQLAVKPDSNAPNSLDEPIKIPLMDDTRPRMASGVLNCMMVERNTTEILSNAPDNPKLAIDSHK